MYGSKADFKQIGQRLDKRTTQTLKSFKFRKGCRLADQEYLVIVLELIKIFRVITIDGIEYVVRSIFGRARPQTIKRVVAILVGTNFVSRCGLDDKFCHVTSSESTFMEFKGINEMDFRLKLLDFYRSCAPEIYNVASELPK